MGFNTQGAASGATSGAATGSAAGPYGMAAGALVGSVMGSGLLGGGGGGGGGAPDAGDVSSTNNISFAAGLTGGMTPLGQILAYAGGESVTGTVTGTAASTVKSLAPWLVGGVVALVALVLLMKRKR